HEPPFEDRLLAVEAAVAVLRTATYSNRAPLEEVADEISILRRGNVANAEADLAAIEAAVLHLDDCIPSSNIRRLATLDPAEAAPYAVLLARHAGGSLARVDRVELIATRLCTTEDEGGGRTLRAKAQVDPFLRCAGVPANAPPTKAISFFEAATQRLMALQS